MVLIERDKGGKSSSGDSLIVDDTFHKTHGYEDSLVQT